MAQPDSLFHTGHRQRLKEKFLDGKLTETEQLELLLTYAIPRRDVRVLSRQLIERFGNVYGVLHAPYSELTSIPGVGHSVAVLLKLFHELMLVSFHNRAERGKYLSDPKFRVEYCRTLLANKPVEEIHVLYLGPDYKLLQEETHSRGTINETAMYVREIAHRAMNLRAVHVLLAHNHPMSNNKFSQPDIEMTNALDAALTVFGIQLLDHLLVTSNGVVHSFRETVWLDSASFFNK
ncbi:MAG: DNA repair protein RadC [Alphaproteobacteria bacterium]|nr:DNA repair protein RadC [Alphaproteobacteria bacterium]